MSETNVTFAALVRLWMADPLKHGDALCALLKTHLADQFGRVEAGKLMADQDFLAIGAAYDGLKPTDFSVLDGRVSAEAISLLPAVWRMDPFGWREAARRTSQQKPPTRPNVRPEERVPQFKAVSSPPTDAQPDKQGAPLEDQVETVTVLLRSGRGSEVPPSTPQEIADRLGRPVDLAKIPDIGRLAALRARAPWFEPALGPILSDLSLARRLGARRARIEPLLLVGAPGIGKTRFVRDLADALGRPLFLQPMAGVAEAMTIVGSNPVYREARAGIAARAMAATGHADPVVLLDEVDKAGSDRQHGNALEALLPLLEPSTARAATDAALMAEVDASHVLWVLTANSIAGLPLMLLSRVRVVRIGRPEAEALPMLIDGFRRDLAESLGIDPEMVPTLRPASRHRLLDELVATGDLRTLRRTWQSLTLAPDLKLQDATAMSRDESHR